MRIKSDKIEKANKSFDSSSIYSSNNEISNGEEKMHELVSEITDMEAGGNTKKNQEPKEMRKRTKRKKSRDPNTSMDSKSSGEISFVLARKN